MAECSDLDRYLSQQYSDDYWSDEAILYAHELIHGLSPAGWRDLSELWRRRDAPWQTRCAQILSQGEQGLAVKLLIDMVKNGAVEVKLAALDSLREAAPEALGAQDRAYLLDEVTQLMRTVGGIHAIMLNDLKLTLIGLS